METSFSQYQNNGFNKALDNIRQRYSDFDLVVNQNHFLHYTETDIKNDIGRYWSRSPMRGTKGVGYAEERMFEIIGLILLNGLYRGQERLTPAEIENSLGDFLRELWEKLTGF